MAYQGEYFMARYGKKAAEHTPPVRKMLELGIPVGAGTDATRVRAITRGCRSTGWSPGKPSAASRCTPKKTASVAKRRCDFIPGQQLVFERARKEGRDRRGSAGGFTALTGDYFSVPEEEIKAIESVLTVVGGKIVHATEEFSAHAPPSLPVLPEWSPVESVRRFTARRWTS